jgi:hypothetical protein
LLLLYLLDLLKDPEQSGCRFLKIQPSQLLVDGEPAQKNDSCSRFRMQRLSVFVLFDTGSKQKRYLTLGELNVGEDYVLLDPITKPYLNIFGLLQSVGKDLD